MARSLEPTNSENFAFWPARERRSWTLVLFFGLMLLSVSRTVGPVTMVALAKEFEWDKDVQVNKYINELDFPCHLCDLSSQCTLLRRQLK